MTHGRGSCVMAIRFVLNAGHVPHPLKENNSLVSTSEKKKNPSIACVQSTAAPTNYITKNKRVHHRNNVELFRLDASSYYYADVAHFFSFCYF
jgi:hypothetical protein